jgi:hypothetical protein
MKRVFIIACTITICITLYGQDKKVNDVGWNLIYENDENGKKLAGNLDTLLRAVRKGEPIRIAWQIEHPTNKRLKVEHFADAGFVTILNDTVVFAQIDPILGQTPNIKDQFISLKENTSWAFCASSLGNNDSMNMNTKTGDILDHKNWRTGIKWFVRIY